MIAEALQLFKTAVEGAAGAASKAHFTMIDGRPREVAKVGADGSVTFLDAAPPDRRHVLASVAQVPTFVEFATEKLNGRPSVWYDASGVRVVVVDDAPSHRADFAAVDFDHDQTFVRLSNLAGTWFPQKAFVRLLRVDLADAATESSLNLLKVSRVIGFSESTGSHGTVELGRQSLGKDIESQIRSEVGDFPDSVTLNVRIFDDPFLTRRFEITCAVDVNPREGTFNLAPLPGQLSEAVDEQVRLIGVYLDSHESIGEADVPLFNGRP